MWLADLLSSRRVNRFFALSLRHATLLVRATALFQEYLAHDSTALSDQIDAVRKEGAAVLRDLTTALRDAFVTPIDRQDIYNLGESVDDMLSYINNAAREITLFNVPITPQMQAIAATLVEAARQIQEAIEHLQKDPQRAWDCARAVQDAEGRVEDQYRRALLDLFAGSDIPTVLKQREVYRHLSNSADRAQSIGRLIGKIVVKAT
jgi:uncharacterized protein Yka (UPF0111/DUF47 family)